MTEWIEVMEREYLADYILAGGGSVKFVTGGPEGSAEVSAAIDTLAAGRGYTIVDLNAAQTKFHRIDQIFFEVARQIDWTGLASDFVAAGFRAAGWQTAKSDAGFDPAAIALENGVEEPVVRTALKTFLRSLYDDYAMSQEFRLAILQLCRSQITGLDHSAAPVVAWLKGELTRIGELKGARIFQKIGRHNARLMLQSLTHWLKINHRPGLVLTLDIARCLENPRRTERREGFYYSASALTEVYETLRQLIDGSSELSGTFAVVFAPPALLSDEKRGVDRYLALKMRIFDDVRNRGIENLLAPLVRLRPEAA